MTRPIATPAELLAAGRLQAVCLSVVTIATTLGPLADRIEPADERWRIAALADLRSLEAAAAQRATMFALPAWVGAERAAIVSALEQVASTAVMAAQAVRTGNASSFTALVRYRLPRVLHALTAGLEAITRAMMDMRPARGVGFAC